jgi:hypothetical protein
MHILFMGSGAAIPEDNWHLFRAYSHRKEEHKGLTDTKTEREFNECTNIVIIMKENIRGGGKPAHVVQSLAVERGCFGATLQRRCEQS